MGELIIITLMAGGMLELIRFNGGVDYIIQKLTKHVNSNRGAELCIAALVGIANFCTANNTIAIITVGPLANDIATRYKVDKRKSASILDTFSCVVQGIILWGANVDRGKTGFTLPSQHHWILVLSGDYRGICLAEYLLALS